MMHKRQAQQIACETDPSTLATCACCGKEQRTAKEIPRGWAIEDDELRCTGCKTGALKSPSRRLHGKSGKSKVGRLKINCLCGETFAVLYRARMENRLLCPRCQQLEWIMVADARLEDFTLSLKWRDKA